MNEDWDDKSKLVVRLDYEGYWEFWYRFDLFLISAFDFETEERMFVAGQVGDNRVSNEEVVISDTLDEVRTALGRQRLFCGELPGNWHYRLDRYLSFAHAVGGRIFVPIFARMPSPVRARCDVNSAE